MGYFKISKNLSGDEVNYIARDPSGVVRLRADSLKKLEEEIEGYLARVKQGEIKIPEEAEAKLAEGAEEKVEETLPKGGKPSQKVEEKKEAKDSKKRKFFRFKPE